MSVSVGVFFMLVMFVALAGELMNLCVWLRLEFLCCEGVYGCGG